MSLFSPLVLNNGATIPNRIAKAAMEENMADADHAPSAGLLRLYKAWAEGETGLIITGNVMVDARAMTGPGGVVLEDDRHLDRFQAWAEAGRTRGAHIWMQINHPGRQMPAALGQETLAPSAIALDLGAQSKRFPIPREMSEADIADVERRFINTAQLAERADFTGVDPCGARLSSKPVPLAAFKPATGPLGRQPRKPRAPACQYRARHSRGGFAGLLRCREA